jgi:hypothetical protein
MTRRVKIVIAVPLAVLAVLALLVGVGLLAGGGAGSDGGGTAGSFDAMEPARQGEVAAGVPEPLPATGDEVMSSEDGAASKSTSGGGVAGEDFAAAVPPASTPSAHYLLRTGDLSLLVARGQLLPTVDRIKAMTAAMSGYVMSSSLGTQTGMGMPEPMPLDMAVSSDGETRSSDAVDAQYAGGDPYASLVVRVPEQQFETAIKRFSKLGEVRGASTSAEDVTSQFVDLQARLRHYRAVERRLLGFLEETTTVSQMLAVQDRVDQVQLTIEELSAQLKSMRETTTYGTLSVYVTEKDRTPAAIDSSNTFGGTFWNSIELLGSGARVTGLVLTALLPFLVVFGLIGALAWYVVRRVRRSRRQAATPAQPA